MKFSVKPDVMSESERVCEMYFSQRLNGWVVEDYAEAEVVMRESALEIPRLPLPAHILDAHAQPAVVPVWEQAKETPLYSVGTEHRRQLRDPFTSQAVRGRRAFIRQPAADLIEERLSAKRLEVIEHVGHRPLRQVMAAVIGIPERLRSNFAHSAYAAMDIGKLGTPAWSHKVLDEACEANTAAENMVNELLFRPDSVPQRSVLSSPASRQGKAGCLSVQEIATNLRSLYTAWLHTTIHLLAASVYFLFVNDGRRNEHVYTHNLACLHCQRGGGVE